MKSYHLFIDEVRSADYLSQHSEDYLFHQQEEKHVGGGDNLGLGQLQEPMAIG